MILSSCHKDSLCGAPIWAINLIMSIFYDELAPLYHLIFQDWDASIRRQGEQLSSIIKDEWPESKSVLDVSCVIGTQAIALNQHGYTVVGSDLSAKEIARAQHEASNRSADITFSVCDMRDAYARHGGGFDVVISADNSLPHLLTDEDIVVALKEMLACASSGGGCLITVRDYAAEERGKNLVKPYGIRIDDGKRYLLLQIWDFDGEYYDLSFFITEEHLASGEVKTHVMRSRYYAISISRLLELMQRALAETDARFLVMDPPGFG
jgi:SAM-dependent methyltransferase